MCNVFYFSVIFRFEEKFVPREVVLIGRAGKRISWPVTRDVWWNARTWVAPLDQQDG